MRESYTYNSWYLLDITLGKKNRGLIRYGVSLKNYNLLVGPTFFNIKKLKYNDTSSDHYYKQNFIF